jgi:hypothetical protein
VRDQTVGAALGALADCGALCVEAVFTGHSLGSAITTLAAVDFVGHLAAPAYGGIVVAANLFTFGSPRVGNQAFAGWAGSILDLDRSSRVTREGDIVPRVPPKVGRKHKQTRTPLEACALRMPLSRTRGPRSPCAPLASLPFPPFFVVVSSASFCGVPRKGSPHAPVARCPLRARPHAGALEPPQRLGESGSQRIRNNAAFSEQTAAYARVAVG